MTLTDEQKRVILQVVNAAETGSAVGDYCKVTVVDDNPKNPGKEISYGRSQITEFGRLYELIDNYIKAGGEYRYNFEQYLPRIGVDCFSKDAVFLSLLRNAGNDPTMRKVQDEMFEKGYFLPALHWAEKEGFTQPLSLLIIYDSFIHSGSILKFLRIRFPERTPAHGGSELRWIGQYTQTRHDWLTLHSLQILRNSNYRTSCYLKQIAKENWNLTASIVMNGITVKGA